MKFGGTSVADASRLRRVARLAADRLGAARTAEGENAGGVLLVLSALAKVTDALFACGRAAKSGDEAGALKGLEDILDRHRAVADELFGTAMPAPVTAALDAARAELSSVLRGAALLREMPDRSLDLLVGRGELLSSALLAAFMGVPWVDARTVLRTDSRFGSAQPRPEEIRKLAAERLLPLMGPGCIAVTQGYIGSDAAGAATTLGRGGSDYSASLFGAAIDASEIQIWTDVEGVLTCDPRIVPEARPVEVLGYDEAAELAAFGAKVLHPSTILPAVERGIPVTVRNSLLPKGRFTTISREAASGRPVTALASRGPVTVITVKTPGMLGGAGFLARMFEAFGRRGVSVDLVSTSEVSVSVTVESGVPVEEIAHDLAAFADVRIENDRAVIALVGEQLRRTPGVAGRAFGALCDINVEMISLGANEINLSLVVARDKEVEVLRRLHAAFFGGGGDATCGDPPGGRKEGDS
jgi:aspartate kinase